MTATPTYGDLFQRNIGVLTEEQQSRARRLKIAVVGVGGVGGAVAFNCARLGVGELRLVDPDFFEPSNMNRQYGAATRTLGRPKASSLVEALQDINPDLEVLSWDCGFSSEVAAGVLDGVDAVVDGIDFSQLSAQLALHDQAGRRGMWVYAGECAGPVITCTAFDPDGARLADTWPAGSQPTLDGWLSLFFPNLRSQVPSELLDGVLSGRVAAVPS